MKKRALSVLLFLFITGNLSSFATAETVVFGKAEEVFADPSDVVVQVDAAGPCGSKYFHIQRANKNFKELTAVALTAFSLEQGLRLFVASCSGDRNILSHAGARKIE
ncbi:hypothetical protein [Nitrosospira sp. Is2]|uniref:hypothetical protein n=1 Tax=Nitrosospira sp. Is2 TaxID=3080532 RepID=UPI0029553DCB|nr:hypothetical protein [Nitrosospira sp. Is2]WON74231.1 hypothetical protein R5L00_01710 [Nitrosospira sp. Is2]